MKIDFPTNLELHPNKKIALEKAIKNSCSNNGRWYEISITYRSETEVILIRIEPKTPSHYVTFHTTDLNYIGEILEAELKFFSLYDGGLELTYFK